MSAVIVCWLHDSALAVGVCAQLAAAHQFSFPVPTCPELETSFVASGLLCRS